MYNRCLDTSVYQRGKQAGTLRDILVDLLRVALRADHQAISGNLQQFRNPIVGQATDADALARLFDRLVMATIHPELLRPQHLLHKAPRLDEDAVAARLIAHAMVQALRILGCQILVERSSQRDIQQLHAATDAQHRHILAQRPANGLKLKLIQRRVTFFKGRMNLLSIDGWMNVAATGQQQTIQLSAHIVQRLKRRDQAGNTACILNRLKIVAILLAIRLIRERRITRDSNTRMHKNDLLSKTSEQKN